MEINKRNTLSLAVVLTTSGLAACGAGTVVKPLWEKYFAGSSVGEVQIDWVKALEVDTYGNVITAGSTVNVQSGYRTENILIASHTGSGQVKWVKTYDLAEEGRRSDETATDAASDEAGNIYVIGMIYRPDGPYSIYTSFLMKVDAYGNKLWSTTFGDEYQGADVDYKNGLVYVNGTSTRVFTSDGDQTLAIPHGTDASWELEIDDLGNIYASGSTFVAKYDASGAQVWKASLPEGLTPASIDVSPYGEVYVAQNVLANEKLRVAKITEQGNTAWTKQFDKPASSAGAVPGLPLIQEGQDGSVVAVASNAQNRKVIKMDAQGNVAWTKNTSDGMVRAAQIDTAGNVYVYGNGKGEKFDASGKSLAKLATPYISNDTVGDAEVVGNALYITDSLNVNNNIKGYLAKYAN